MNARIRAHLVVAYGIAALSLVFGLGGFAFAAGANVAAAARAQVCQVTDKPNGGQILDCDPAVAPTPSSSASPSPSAGPTLTPTPSPSTSSTPPATGAFPTATSVGVGTSRCSAPRTAFNGTMVIRSAGVYENVQVNGSVEVRVTGVTLRCFDVVGGVIDTEDSGRCANGLVIEDTTLRKTVATDRGASNGAIGPGGYTARRVAILDRAEGFRIGGRSDAACAAVLIDSSYARIARPSDISCDDWHGDAVQGFDAPRATILHSTLDARNQASCGTAGVFYGSAETWGNQPLTVRGLLLFGGNTAYRPDTPHDTEGLRIVEGTYSEALGTDSTGNYTCRRATRWVDNAISNAAGTALRPVTC